MNIKPQVSKLGESDEKWTNVNQNIRILHTSFPDNFWQEETQLAIGEEYADFLMNYRLSVYFSMNQCARMIKVYVAQKLRREGMSQD